MLKSAFTTAKAAKIEAPHSKLLGIFPRKVFCLFFDSLAKPAASHGISARCCGQFRAMHLFGWRKGAYCIASGEF